MARRFDKHSNKTQGQQEERAEDGLGQANEPTLCNEFGSKGTAAYSQGPSTKLFGTGNGFKAATSVEGSSLKTINH